MKKHNGFTIITDTHIYGGWYAIARHPAYPTIVTDHWDNEQDALDTIIIEIDNYLFG